MLLENRLKTFLLFIGILLTWLCMFYCTTNGIQPERTSWIGIGWGSPYYRALEKGEAVERFGENPVSSQKLVIPLESWAFFP